MNENSNEAMVMEPVQTYRKQVLDWLDSQYWNGICNVLWGFTIREFWYTNGIATVENMLWEQPQNISKFIRKFIFCADYFLNNHRAVVILHSSSYISYLVTKIMIKTLRIKKILLQKKYHSEIILKYNEL